MVRNVVFLALVALLIGCGRKDKDELSSEGAPPSSTYVSWSEAESSTWTHEESLATVDTRADLADARADLAEDDRDTAGVRVSTKFSSSPGTVYSTVDAGYPLQIELSTPLSTRSAHAGDTFRGRLVELVISSEGHTVVPVGASVRGRVVAVTGTMPGENPGLTLTLTEMDGRSIHTRLLTMNGSGTVSPGPVDSVIGAGATDTTTGVPVGSVGGTLDLPSGQRLRFALDVPLRVTTRFGNQP